MAASTAVRVGPPNPVCQELDPIDADQVTSAAGYLYFRAMKTVESTKGGVEEALGPSSNRVLPDPTIANEVTGEESL